MHPHRLARRDRLFLHGNDNCAVERERCLQCNVRRNDGFADEMHAVDETCCVRREVQTRLARFLAQYSKLHRADLFVLAHQRKFRLIRKVFPDMPDHPHLEAVNVEVRVRQGGKRLLFLRNENGVGFDDATLV